MPQIAPAPDRRDALAPDYPEHRRAVLRTLARRCAWLDPGDREALLHDAYAVMLEKARSGQLNPMPPEQVRAYLIQTALYKALDERKRAGRRRSAPLDGEALNAPAPGRAPDELAAEGLESDQLREIVAELPERRQTIIKLRFFFDRTPAEIQRFMNISERTYRKELERGLKQVAEGYELVREGRFCASRRSLILAFVAGLAGPNRAADARRHLASCPGCARWAAELREGTWKVAALIPPVPVVGGRIGHLPVGDWWIAARDGVERVVGSVRNHVGSWTGNVDTAAVQYAAAARPGAVATVVAGCIAVGGGATYCVTSGVVELPSRGDRAAATVQRKPAAPRNVAPVATRTPRVEPAAPKTAPQRAEPKRSSRPAERRRTSLAPSVAKSVATAPPRDEFGFERRPAQSIPSPPAPQPVPQPPAPQPPGEFDP